MSRPTVLCFSGHDPSGGAGVQADIETLISHRCHAASVITCLTEQDSRNVKRVLPQDAGALIDQAHTLFSDLEVSAIKIGLIGSHHIAEAIGQILREHAGIPVVLDPVLAAGGGTDMASQRLLSTIVEQLLPLTTLITPNSDEARRLTGHQTLSDCAKRLQSLGADHVLITGTHEATALVENRLWMADGVMETFHWQRLPHSYHGSGCTLASAIAALLAQGVDLFSAVSEAQDYTWQSLEAAYRPGQGQFNPARLFWMDA